ncbi:MAG TPA: SCP2 sterol-binding domain-containing protein [Desulfomonilia bacterium]|nr:SCP2 sterol-binding domain-containing protein [Desulfomonilia bacterium]
MKVLAINSSARPEGQTKTKMMLDRLVEGMRKAGAGVEVVDLRKKDIKFCIGCYTCWTKTPGMCILRDDMTAELFPKWLASDLVVYASPLFHFTINAQMKTFIERTLPVLQPFFEKKGEETVHPWRHRHPRVVMLSVCGFPELSAFDQLSSWARYVFGRSGLLAAEIYRPMAEVMAQPQMKAKAVEIFDAVEMAGREIVENGFVSPGTMAVITQDLMDDPECFLQHSGNLMWKTCIEEKVTPKEFAERNMLPRPDSVEGYLNVLSFGFNAAAAKDLKAVYQFAFTGGKETTCHFSIAGGKIRTASGPAEKPDITITAPFDLWMDIMTKKADGQQMFLEQKYAVQGDLNLLLRMNELFGA